MNVVQGGDLHLKKARIETLTKESQIHIILEEDYLKSLSYQKILREKRRFYLSGDLLYGLYRELLRHINDIFVRIRLNDVDIRDENKTLLFLRKFSRSSERIHNKLTQRLSKKEKHPVWEVFAFPVEGLDKLVAFTKSPSGKNLLVIRLPSNYMFNRLISFLDKMEFADILRINESIRNHFLDQFKELKRNVEDKRQQIDMKYALELAQERIMMLIRDHDNQHRKIQLLLTQNDLYKRSYYSLRKRVSSKDDLLGKGKELEDLEVVG